MGELAMHLTLEEGADPDEVAALVRELLMQQVPVQEAEAAVERSGGGAAEVVAVVDLGVAVTGSAGAASTASRTLLSLVHGLTARVKGVKGVRDACVESGDRVIPSLELTDDDAIQAVS